MLLNYSHTWDLVPLVWPLYCLHGWHLFLWDVLLPCIQPSISPLLWLSFWNSGFCISIPGVCLLYKKSSFSVSALLYPSPPLGYMYPSKPIYSTPQKSVTLCFPRPFLDLVHRDVGPFITKVIFYNFCVYFSRLTAFLCLYKLSVRIILLYLPMLPRVFTSNTCWGHGNLVFFHSSPLFLLWLLTLIFSVSLILSCVFSPPLDYRFYKKGVILGHATYAYKQY